ncbi:MAG: ribonuclease P protein component [bacterium]|nr:ribonuclease P protein component [bacterium]
MLPRLYRLKKESDFDRLFKKGMVKSGEFLTIRFIDNGRGTSRFGFVVGSKSFKKASLRNKLKRKLREAVKGNLALIEPGKDVAFAAKTGAIDKSVKETGEHIFSLLNQAGLIKKQQTPQQ